MLIAFEGIDGSGKTSISTKFAAATKAWWTKEPMFDSEEADRLNEMPIVGAHREAAFLMDRVQHQIYMKSSEDKVIVCDRYLWSALVYGYIFSPETYEFLRAIYAQPFFRVPDCFVFVDTPAEVCAARRPGRSADAEKTLWSLKQLEHSYHDIHPSKISEWANVPVITISGAGKVEDAVASLIVKINRHWPRIELEAEQTELFDQTKSEEGE